MQFSQTKEVNRFHVACVRNRERFDNNLVKTGKTN